MVVRQKSAAKKADLLLHSTGGVISRYYIDCVMVPASLLLDPLTLACASTLSDTVVGLDSTTALQLDGLPEAPLYQGSL
ncbi:MAG: hypothetical protein NTW32_11775 [Chloroflexi bacterium]|nr:hypothetical protein [Chloroflexota bacterium]